MCRKQQLRMLGMLLSGVLVSGMLVPTALAQSSPPRKVPAKQPAAASLPAVPTAPPTESPYAGIGLSPRAVKYYQSHWGADSFGLKMVESGMMIRFNYRVIHPELAKTLNDKKESPYLFDESAHVKLVVPSMEKVGQLRQSSAPEAGKFYWMVFSNKGNFVKRGDRVGVEIGKFRVDGLVVQ